MTGYLYGGGRIGRWNTRHKAVGVAAVRGREEGEYQATRAGEGRGVPEFALTWTKNVDIIPEADR